MNGALWAKCRRAKINDSGVVCSAGYSLTLGVYGVEPPNSGPPYRAPRTDRVAIRTRYAPFRARLTSKRYYFRLEQTGSSIRRTTSTSRSDRLATAGVRAAILARIAQKRPSRGRLRLNRKWKYGGDPIFQLLDPDFLFDPLYIRGSISHRYGATHVKTLTLRHCKPRGT